MVSEELLAQHNLTENEYRRIVEILKREPTITELGIFSVMWSEHCSYKSSRVHLRRLPTKGRVVIQGPGENAGIIDIGDGLASAFKIESHNHPSFIEPFQGAATGVGGILRDIFTMGARPIAAMNSLRFGPLHKPQNRRILEGVVGGIAFYGNCFGVPTLGGEVYFADCYSQNPLVNAFALGIFEKDQIFYGRAHGAGNPVIYAGAKTGRDGIHGATMASAGFGDDAGAKRPNVQIGDPFMEKLLLEACLEAMQKGLIIGIQDMGAAGLTCSSCEMGARAGTGVELDLDDVPQRESGMTAYEVMLSESQERMLLVADKNKEREVFDVFHKWGLDAVRVGRVTSDGQLRVRQHGELVAEIPNSALAGQAPVYQRPLLPPKSTLSARLDDYSFLDGCEHAVIESFFAGTPDFNHLLKLAVSSPNLACRQWVWEQYDHMVQSNTILGPGSDAAVVRIKGTKKALAMTLDGPSYRVARNPREGAKMAVAEACRNIVCAGGQPLAATNCLNFGNPEHPEVMWQFSEVVDGMSEACTFFNTPITGGNVSFYNETFGEDIYPTPVLGMVGLIEDISLVTPSSFRAAGGSIVLIETIDRPVGRVNLDEERAIQNFVSAAIRDRLVHSAHDVSEGGIAVALAECCYSTFHRAAIGAQVRVPSHLEPVKDLFGEVTTRVILTTTNARELLKRAEQMGLNAYDLGKIGGERLTLYYESERIVDIAMGDLEYAWRQGLAKLLNAA
ncbi:MAG: phosphoribosylformylglycinamidine synthase subunit PurL [Acidobacteria bacterium]|nr:MAG: phosphoribosylformylglycinamidine synthase subunit PurL [Acidobacteriota bacterium]